jgi:hypothetical protein
MLERIPESGNRFLEQDAYKNEIQEYLQWFNLN